MKETMALIYNGKRTGPKIDPRGTPFTTDSKTGVKHNSLVIIIFITTLIEVEGMFRFPDSIYNTGWKIKIRNMRFALIY